MADEKSGRIFQPIETVINGIAATIGGWWGGRSAAAKVTEFRESDDALYRERYEHSRHKFADRSYAHVRPAYQLGHLARYNPDYRGQSFDAIEPELRVGWSEQIASRHGDWDRIREFARDAYVGAGSVPAREAAHRQQNSEDHLGEEARPDLPSSRR